VARHPGDAAAHRRRRRHLPAPRPAAAGHHLGAASTASIPATSSPPSRTRHRQAARHPGLFDPTRCCGRATSRVRQPRHRPAARLS
jgi:hypothetical protein